MTATTSFQILAFILLVIFLAYVVMIMVPFVRLRPMQDGDAGAFEWHVFVPCRDEAVVIGDTLDHLRGTFPQAHVWAIDDASDDETAAIVKAKMAGDAMVHLVSRVRPEARQGKGAALNAAYKALCGWLPATTDHAGVIVVVVDADGRLSDNALAQAAGPKAFVDDQVGAAQVSVWMSNRDDPAPVPGNVSKFKQWWGRYLIRMQDIEFRTTITAMQSLRSRTLTVGLGGNGQFARLSALDRIAEEAETPWHSALLEDYELGLNVMLVGYISVFLHSAHVEQEGLPTTGRLLTQRTRWCQGGMQCASYLPQIFTSEYIPNVGALEASYFLLMPFTELLGLIVWPTVFITMIAAGSLWAGGLPAWFMASWWLIPLIILTGVVPFAIWPVLYRKRAARHVSWAAVAGWALGYWIYTYQSYVCVVRALYRLVTGRSGWAKTRRNQEADRQLVAREV